MKAKLAMGTIILGLSLFTLAQNMETSERFNARKIKTPHLTKTLDCAEEVPSVTFYKAGR